MPSIALQIHWHNPQKLSGLRDGSGVAIWYTKNLRQYDADMMRMGNVGVSMGNSKRMYGNVGVSNVGVSWNMLG